MTRWEYLIVALPPFEPAKAAPGESASVELLNARGDEGWEAIGMSALGDGLVAVVMKRPSAIAHDARRGSPSRP